MIKLTPLKEVPVPKNGMVSTIVGNPRKSESSIASLAKKLGLTPQELVTLEWVAEGKTNREIGDILGVSHKTAAKHLEHIYLKFGVTSRTEAVVHYFRILQTAW